jgi:hypothetical protein
MEYQLIRGCDLRVAIFLPDDFVPVSWMALAMEKIWS